MEFLDDLKVKKFNWCSRSGSHNGVNLKMNKK